MDAKTLWTKINNENANLLFNLYERWQSEREYENIADYLEVIQKHIPEAYKIRKRPFGIDCTVDDGVLVLNIIRKGKYLKIDAKLVTKK